ncbi:hypothetical protein HDU91_002588, partial [Kappamyces sp. JEL0680]
SYPIAKLLDYLLGHKEGSIYRHAGLKELVALHGEDQAGPLSKDEVSILRAVLDLRSKTVKDVMTPLDDVFMFSVSQKLDKKVIQQILRAGHSRIPIFLGKDRNAILGTLLVKQLLLNDPDMETPLSTIKLRRLPRVCSDTPLFEMLHIFEAGSSHMALVVDELSANVPEGLDSHSDYMDSPRWVAKTEYSRFKCLGIITLEDVIEELIGEEIIDETDVYIDMQTKIRVSRTELGASAASDSGSACEGGTEEGERRPLLGGSATKPVNPNSALYYRPINLPSSLLDRQQKKLEKITGKKNRKRLFAPHDLLSDLYSDSNTGSRPSTSQHSPATRLLGETDVIPEIALSMPAIPSEIKPSLSRSI